MKTYKFSQFPWAAKGSERSTATWVTDSMGKRVCTMSPNDHDWDNCQLIAAAPAMLAALMMCETDEGAAAFGSRDYAERRLRAINEIVREAIAKATEQQ